METLTIIESFTDLEDAMYYLDTNLTETARDGWMVEQGGIQFINNQWRVGLVVGRKRVKKDEQLLPNFEEEFDGN
jgi:hypothetical protein